MGCTETIRHFPGMKLILFFFFKGENSASQSDPAPITLALALEQESHFYRLEIKLKTSLNGIFFSLTTTSVILIYYGGLCLVWCARCGLKMPCFQQFLQETLLQSNALPLFIAAFPKCIFLMCIYCYTKFKTGHGGATTLLPPRGGTSMCVNVMSSWSLESLKNYWQFFILLQGKEL